jgi:hypothetical protein
MRQHFPKLLFGPLRSHRPRKIVALSRIAAQPRERFRLLLLFNPLGDHGHIQGVRQTNNGIDDRLAFRIQIHPRDEGLIDLQSIKMQRAQVTERRIPGAEIVESDPPNSYKGESNAARAMRAMIASRISGLLVLAFMYTETARWLPSGRKITPLSFVAAVKPFTVLVVPVL